MRQERLQANELLEVTPLAVVQYIQKESSQGRRGGVFIGKIRDSFQVDRLDETLTSLMEKGVLKVWLGGSSTHMYQVWGRGRQFDSYLWEVEYQRKKQQQAGS